MNALLLTSPEQTSFNEALQYGRAYVETLNAYQQARLVAFAQQQLEGAHRTAVDLLQRNPGYTYPVGCEGVERGNYWLERVTAYRPAVEVLALLATPALAATAAATEAKDPAPRKQPTSLRNGVKTEEVRAFFGSPFLQSPRELAAALAALSIKGFLPGSAPQIIKWFEAKIGGKVSRKTLSDSLKQITDEGILASKEAQKSYALTVKWLEAKVKQ